LSRCKPLRACTSAATYQRLAQPENAHHYSTIFVVDFSDGQLLEVELLDEDDETTKGNPRQKIALMLK
jgi:hypothetical protein